MAATALVAREYLRVSRDRSGRDKSVDEQHADHVAWSARRGIRLHDKPYADKASASKYGRKVRGDYVKLIADLKADQFDADILLIWESSRGSRKVSEWATLIELCEERGVGIAVHTHDRIYNPANPRDVRSMHEDATDSQYESGKISARVQRARDAELTDGRVHGVPGYGFKRVRDDRGRPITQVEVEAEADVIRELYARILRGHTVREIGRDFAARGVRSRNGKVFSEDVLGVMARRASYGGYREGADGTLYEAKWQPIVPRAEWLKVRALRSKKKQAGAKDARAQHFLSGIVPCGVCGSAMNCRPRGDGESVYGCRDGCVTVNAAELDAYITGHILALLSVPGQWQAIRDREQGDVGEDLARVRIEVAALRDRDNALTAKLRGVLAAGLDETDLLAARKDVRAQVTALEAHERALSTPEALTDLITPGADVTARWAAAHMPARRAVARLLLQVPYIGAPAIIRARVARHRTPIWARVMWHTSKCYEALPYFELIEDIDDAA
jgi:DNA invertase Pin-like site-specific DNA recombinase